jgi:hypothetical protein
MAPTTNNNGWPSDAMLVCIDLECHCFNQSWAEFQQGIRRRERRVCEIGVASFDPRKVPFANSGDRAVATWPHMKAKNFAIIENKHTVPKKHPGWCKVGDANAFNFGETQWVRLANIKRVVTNYIRGLVGRGSQREIKFLFFDCRNDIKWLDELDISLKTEFPNSCVVDIQDHPYSTSLAGHRQQISASTLFRNLRFKTQNCHNGGNDAVWELRAYLAILTFDDPNRPSYDTILDLHGNSVVDANWDAETVDPWAVYDGSYDDYDGAGTFVDTSTW